MFKTDDRVQDKLGNIGSVLYRTNSFGTIGYRIAWDKPRFGKDSSVCGPKALSLVKG